MNQSAAGSASGIQIVNDCLMVQLGAHLDEDGLQRVGNEILTCLQITRSRGVLINVSQVTILGSYGFTILRRTAGAIGMMGATPVFVGFQPGVAAALVDLGMDFSGILTAVNPADAFEVLAESANKKTTPVADAGRDNEKCR